jgi:hypothetical protein
VTRAQEALLHVSELTHDTALFKKSLNEFISVGQRLSVKVSRAVHAIYIQIDAIYIDIIWLNNLIVVFV